MSDTKIFLPPHAPTEKVFKVIQKIMGCDFTQEVFEEHYMTNMGHTITKKPVFDEFLPSSSENPWFVKLKSSSFNKIALLSPEHFQFYIEDICSNKWNSMYFLDTYDNQLALPGERGMNPDACVTWATIGKRLIDFFGGRMLYSTSLDENDKNNWYIKKKGKLPIKKPGQTSDEIWHIFQNLFLNEPIISFQELKSMEKYCAINEQDKNLMLFLKRFEHLQQLDSSLSKKSEHSIKKHKI